MSRAVALLLALGALVLPSIARAHGRGDVRVPGRVDVRVPGRASGAIVAEFEGCVGSPEFFLRAPEGYADSVNVYAAMAKDPVNNRDPTGGLLPGTETVVGVAVASEVATACSVVAIPAVVAATCILNGRATGNAYNEFVWDEFNRDVRVQCPTCNEGHKWEGKTGDYQ